MVQIINKYLTVLLNKVKCEYKFLVNDHFLNFIVACALEAHVTTFKLGLLHFIINPCLKTCIDTDKYLR